MPISLPQLKREVTARRNKVPFLMDEMGISESKYLAEPIYSPTHPEINIIKSALVLKMLQNSLGITTIGDFRLINFEELNTLESASYAIRTELGKAVRERGGWFYGDFGDKAKLLKQIKQGEEYLSLKDQVSVKPPENAEDSAYVQTEKIATVSTTTSTTANGDKESGSNLAAENNLITAGLTPAPAPASNSLSREEQVKAYDTALGIEQNAQPPYLWLPISDFGLQSRSLNILKSLKINTLADLRLHTEKEIFRHRGVGTGVQEDIRQKLYPVGVIFFDDLKDTVTVDQQKEKGAQFFSRRTAETKVVPVARPALPASPASPARSVIDLNDPQAKRQRQDQSDSLFGFTPESKPACLATKLETLSLTSGFLRRLNKAGIYTLDDLRLCDEKDLLALPYVQQKYIDDLKQKAAPFGLLFYSDYKDQDYFRVQMERGLHHASAGVDGTVASQATQQQSSADQEIQSKDFWRVIDLLAERKGISVSALAKLADLDATAFNPSKRNSNGHDRWLSTETLVKVFEVTGNDFSQLPLFMNLKTSPMEQLEKKEHFSVDEGEEIQEALKQLVHAHLDILITPLKKLAVREDFSENSSLYKLKDKYDLVGDIALLPESALRELEGTGNILSELRILKVLNLREQAAEIVDDNRLAKKQAEFKIKYGLE